MPTLFAPILAHAGGFSWDEALLVLAPIVVIAALLFLANSRAKALGRRAARPDDAARDDPGPGQDVTRR